jgi:Protein of unknown function (DUF3500)
MNDSWASGCAATIFATLCACGGTTSSTVGGTTEVTTDAGVACAALTGQQARVACGANAVLDTLSSTEKASVNFALTDFTNRSKWNNLPVQMKPRAGVQLGSLSAGTQAAVLDLMTLSLSDTGQQTATGLLRADDYLGTKQGGYGSSLYSIAIFGTPSASGDFEVMFGGHHMAFNLNFVSGGFYPVPQHLGAEPKAAFDFNGVTYNPMAPKGDAMFAIYDALDATQKASAYLSGQSFSDVVVAPDLDYGKGASRTSPSAYPTGSNRKGVLLSSLTSAQLAAVTTAVEAWVRQYPTEVADPLMADYLASTALADTYFAWGGASAGPSKEVSGSYLRLDGPRLWIELVVQGGIVIQGTTHYHSIFHDKTKDYGGQF